VKANFLGDFRIQRSDVQFIGRKLQEPESILAEKYGTLRAVDAPGGIMKILPDESQTLITPETDARFGRAMDGEERLARGTLPNGLAFTANGDILIPNSGNDAGDSRRNVRRAGLENPLIGCLVGAAVPYFRSPVAGVPMVPW